MGELFASAPRPHAQRMVPIAAAMGIAAAGAYPAVTAVGVPRTIDTASYLPVPVLVTAPALAVAGIGLLLIIPVATGKELSLAEQRWCSWAQVRPRRRSGAGQHHSHGHAYAPAAALRQRPRPGHRCPRPRPPGRRLEPADRQPAPFTAARYYPAALDAWRHKAGGLTRPDAGKILGAAPTPAMAAELPLWKLRLMMHNAGRQRGINEDAERIHMLFRQPAARQLPAVEEAMGIQAKALLVQLNAVCKAVDELAKAVERTFRTHPDAPVMLSFLGIGPGVGARLLAEIGDDRTRFATAGGLKAYAGSAPITRASGKRKYVGRRFVKNNRLDHTGRLWAFATLTHSPGANAQYRRRREAGDWHAQAEAPVQPHARAASPLPTAPMPL
jgi:hypothetical protein